MLKSVNEKAKQIRKLEQEEIQKWQKQFKNDLEKVGKKEQERTKTVNNFEFEKNKSKINNINFKNIYKFWNRKFPQI
ncbi:hypothetical protein [Spiroplasma endosymbiont of Virgichneumon dumeticola]|uniref:hypothetical protein n=1 Tax=Spiroplasma endosymbiont of Virgichneumon dumeticola TaxID=3139323 RepID=UPI0035C9071E